MAKKSIWVSKIPDEEGWYWIRYRNKWDGMTICPCVVTILGADAVAKTSKGDVFSRKSRNADGFRYAKFGPKIEIPKGS